MTNTVDVATPFRGAATSQKSIEFSQKAREQDEYFNLFRLMILALSSSQEIQTPEEPLGFFDTLVQQIFPSNTGEENSGLSPDISGMIEELRGIVSQPSSREKTTHRDALVERFYASAPDGTPMGLLRTNLLDLIARPESGGNYNIVSNFAEPPRDSVGHVRLLETMTVGEILQWQKQQRDAGAQSTAAGRYQVISTTLKGLVDEGKIGTGDKFDHATQDRIGLLLAERRGLNEFLAGNITATKFADNLSYEWAGIQGANGRGQYDGDGLNHAGLGHTTLRNSIVDLKNGFQMNGLDMTGQTFRVSDVVAPRQGPDNTPHVV